ncbi:nitrilase 3 [Striga asiatica]|uniref:Nitrilase 3 n=1 Tax=Striga asiatica TaxID=4170 RepID=A0A5A7RH56_STRAF|nr:nitrilase 3 [Striga asiatica]
MGSKSTIQQIKPNTSATAPRTEQHPQESITRAFSLILFPSQLIPKCQKGTDTPDTFRSTRICPQPTSSPDTETLQHSKGKEMVLSVIEVPEISKEDSTTFMKWLGYNFTWANNRADEELSDRAFSSVD